MASVGRINRTINKSRSFNEAGDFRKALTHNLRAIGMMERVARLDALHGLADRPTLAGLQYEQAGILAQLNEWERAIAAGQAAELLYTDMDPTHGDPGLVAEKVHQFRAEHGDQATVPFEAHIGDAANARSFLALLLARHQGAAATDSVERLGRSAIETFSELTRVGVTYGRGDLSRVRDQVSQARRLLTPDLPSPAWRLGSADILSAGAGSNQETKTKSRAASRDPRTKLQEHMESCAVHVAANNYRAALAESLATSRTLRRLRKSAENKRDHYALAGFVYYHQALLWEKNSKGTRAISAARESVSYYEHLDPTELGRKSVADAVITESCTAPGNLGARPEDLIAALAETRSLLALLLATYEIPGRRRERDLTFFSQDPTLTIRHEINVLDSKSFFASRDLVHCSRRSSEDHERMFEQNNEAIRILYTTRPDLTDR